MHSQSATPQQPHSGKPRRLYESSLSFLLFNNTTHPSPHHALCSFQTRFSTFIAHVSQSHVNTLWTQYIFVYLSFFIWYEAPQAVKMGDNSRCQAERELRSLSWYGWHLSLIGGPMVVWLKDWPRDWRVAGSIPETTDFLTNSSGQATNARVFLFTKQCKLVPAS